MLPNIRGFSLILLTRRGHTGIFGGEERFSRESLDTTLNKRRYKSGSHILGQNVFPLLEQND